MNAVFSFFSKPYTNNNKRVHGSVEDLLFKYSWMLSVLSAKKNFDKVFLVTDNFGYNLLVNEYMLSFDNVSLSLNDIQDTPSELWAFGKIIAYKEQVEPFIHIDYDAFIFDPLPKKSLTSCIIVESVEYYDMFTYYEGGNSFLKNANYSSKYFRLHSEINYAYNCGIFGGNNLQLIKDYCNEAESIVRFVKNNYKVFSQSLDPIHKGLFSIIFEQSNLALCLKFYNKTPFVLLDHPNSNNINGYTHLKAYKQFQSVTNKVLKRIKKDFPDFWHSYSYQCIVSNPKNKQYYTNEPLYENIPD